MRRFGRGIAPSRRSARVLAALGMIVGAFGLVVGFTVPPGHLASTGFALASVVAGLGLLGIGLTNLREAVR